MKYISKEIMQRLVKNEIILNLDFTYLNVGVDCTKGKPTKHTKKVATWSIQLLEILLIKKCILSPLIIIFHDMGMSIYYMRNFKPSMP